MDPAVEDLVAFTGCTKELAIAALQKHRGNREQAAQAVLEGTVTLQEAPAVSGWDTEGTNGSALVPTPSSHYASAPTNSPQLPPASEPWIPPANQAGWSAESGPWSHLPPATTPESGPLTNRYAPAQSEDEQIKRALEESLLSQSGFLPDAAPVARAYEDTLSPMDQIRQLDPGSPVALLSSSSFLPWLPLLLHGLYAMPAFRNAILSLKLDHASLDSHLRYTYDGYWNATRLHPPWASAPLQNFTKHAQLDFLRSIQRLFVFMSHTRRKTVNVQDVANAFNLRPSSDQPPPVKSIKEFLQKLMEAHQVFRESESQQQLVDAAEQPNPFDLQVVMLDSSAPADAEPISPGIFDAAYDTDIYSAIDNLFTSTGENKEDLYYLAKAPASLIVTFTRPPRTLDSFGQEKSTMKLEAVLRLDRYSADRREAIHAARKKKVDLLEQRKVVQEAKATITTHQGKDMVKAIEASVAYLAKEGDASMCDGSQASEMKSKLEALLEVVKSEARTLDGELEDVQQELDALFSGDEWQSLPPYDLVAVTYHDGLPSKGHVHIHFKAGDGKWYKAVGDDLSESSLDRALKDSSGMHMHAGCYSAMYTRRDVPDEVVPGPEDLVDAVTADNYVFKDTFLNAPEVTKDWDLPPMPELQIQAIQLGSDLPPYEDATPRDILMDSNEELRQDAMQLDPGASTELMPTADLASQLQSPMPPSITIPSEPDPNTTEPVTPKAATSQALNPLRGGVGSDDEGVATQEVELVPRAPELGLADEEDSSAFDVTGSVGKIGGPPAWLDPALPLRAEDLVCELCQGDMRLLLQFNAPGESGCKFRTLYMFSCCRPDCLKQDPNKAIKVYRMQLPGTNGYYHLQPKKERTTLSPEQRKLSSKLWRDHRSKAKEFIKARNAMLCSVCQRSGEFACRYCEGRARFCSKGCYKLAWPSHKAFCRTGHSKVAKAAVPQVTPPEVVAERCWRQVHIQLKSEPIEQADDILAMDHRERINLAPTQVMRYYRVERFSPDEAGPAPMWLTAHQTPDPGVIPVCEGCGAERECEFQVIGHVTGHLNLDANAPPFQFNSIAVYTCKAECWRKPEDLRLPSTKDAFRGPFDPPCAWSREYVVYE